MAGAVPSGAHLRSAANGQVPTLSTRERCFLGAMGAMVPVLVRGLKTEQVHEFITRFQTAVFISEVLYVLCAIALGTLLLYFSGDESNRWKAMLLGMSAPALFTSMVTETPGASSRQRVVPPVEQASVSPPDYRGMPRRALVPVRFGWVPPAVDDVDEGRIISRIRMFEREDICIAPESTRDQLLRGFTAGSSQRFAIYLTDTFPTADAAEAALRSLPDPYNQGHVMKVASNKFLAVIANGKGKSLFFFGLSRELGDRQVQVGVGQHTIRTEDYDVFSGRWRALGAGYCKD